MSRIPAFADVLKEREHRECLVKTAKYTSLQGAERGRKRMEERYPSDTFEAYKCNFCGAFHIGHIKLHNKQIRGS